MSTVTAPMPTGTKADMIVRLASAQAELTRRDEAARLQLQLRDQLIVEAIDVTGLSRTEVAEAIGKHESTVRKVVAAA